MFLGLCLSLASPLSLLPGCLEVGNFPFHHNALLPSSPETTMLADWTKRLQTVKEKEAFLPFKSFIQICCYSHTSLKLGSSEQCQYELTVGLAGLEGKRLGTCK